MTHGCTEQFDALVIELDGTGPAVELTQPNHMGDGHGDDVIRLHPLQVRRLAELAGLPLLAETDAAELRRLRRLVRVIHERAAELAHWLTNLSDHKHADLTAELHMAQALADLAAEAAAEGDPAIGPKPRTGTQTGAAATPTTTKGEGR